MIWNWVIDHIPLWGWMIIFGVPTVVVLYYVWPIFLPLWRALPAPVKTLIVAVVVGIFATLGGRWRGRKNAEEEERRRNAEALQKRAEVDHDVDTKSDAQVRKELRDNWTRDDP